MKEDNNFHSHLFNCIKIIIIHKFADSNIQWIYQIIYYSLNKPINEENQNNI